MISKQMNELVSWATKIDAGAARRRQTLKKPSCLRPHSAKPVVLKFLENITHLKNVFQKSLEKIMEENLEKFVGKLWIKIQKNFWIKIAEKTENFCEIFFLYFFSQFFSVIISEFFFSNFSTNDWMRGREGLDWGIGKAKSFTKFW